MRTIRFLHLAGVLTLLMAVVPQTEAKRLDNFFGHWAASQLTELSAGHFVTGPDKDAFSFRADDPAVVQLLRCARQVSPQRHVFIFGKTDENVAAHAFICMGEISLSTCEAKDQKTDCEI